MSTETIASYALISIVISILCFFGSYTDPDKPQKSVFWYPSIILFVIALIMLGFDAWYKQAQLPAVLLWLQAFGIFVLLVNKILKGE